MSDVDVLIAGFGPAGATAANLLGAAGVRTLVVERSRELYPKPRAFALDHEIMRVFQNIGLAGEIAQYTAPFTDSAYYGVDGQLIKRLGALAPPYPLGWPPSMVFMQPPVEAALRASAQRQAAVEVALGTTLTAFEREAGGVVATLRDDAGRERQVRARYLVGCDGASSTVRALAGLPLRDLGFDEPWLVIDVRVNAAAARRLPQESIQYCEPARPATYLIGVGDHRRWEISLRDGEDPQAMATDARVWSLLARWLSPDDAELWRYAAYRFHALVAERWRDGPVFIAGDAAHQQPPFTGQGMCQGVRDVANLTWKLVRVLRGQGADALLDTYAAERRRHVERLTSTIKGIGALICERDPDAARARDARLIAEAGGVVSTVPRQALIPPIEGGCLAGDGHRANGTLFPQPRVRQGARTALLDDIVGTGLRVVTAPGFAGAPRADLLARLGATMVRLYDAPDRGLTECDGVLARWFASNECAAAIVRPDHYVYAVARDAAALDEQLVRLDQWGTPS